MYVCELAEIGKRLFFCTYLAPAPAMPPQPDQKFSILRKTWEIDLGQDVGAVGNVNKGKLQRNPHVCVCFVLAILCAVYGRQRVCVWEGEWCGGVCAVRGLNFLPVEHFIKA